MLDKIYCLQRTRKNHCSSKDSTSHPRSCHSTAACNCIAIGERMFEYGFKTIELETGKSSIGRTYKKHMELSCVLQHREVGSHKTRFCTTNLADESPSFDNHGCTLMKKTCNGFYSQLSLEDTPVRCLNKG